MITLEEGRKKLKEFFGFDDFREKQIQPIKNILAGKDGSVLMPTGGGKSICYQLPALCFNGITIVVSPLISLMKDQVDALKEKGIAADLINSTLTDSEYREVCSKIKGNKLKLLYVAPERFASDSFMQMMKGVEVSLFAVDEAHCLSQWGHDFRPLYVKLGEAKKALGNPQTIALTATATVKVRNDIKSVLGFNKGSFETLTGFSRPNLKFRVSPMKTDAEKIKKIRRVSAYFHNKGIVYCSTRKSVEKVTEELQAWGVDCLPYHAGLSDEEREDVQNQFMNKKIGLVVATNAFGMGIDRDDIRFVIHYEVCGSIEALVQEAGRAGRDGKNSLCDLLYSSKDLRTQHFFIHGANPKEETILQVYYYLLKNRNKNNEIIKTVEDMAKAMNIRNSMQVNTCLSILVKYNYIERVKRQGIRCKVTKIKEVSKFLNRVDFDLLRKKRREDKNRLDKLVSYATNEHECRQSLSVQYFDPSQKKFECGHCDNCLIKKEKNK